MKVLHLIGGKEGNGSKNHLIPLLDHCDRSTIHLAVFDKGDIYDEAKKRNIPVTHLQQRSRYDMTVLFRLKKLIADEKINLLHSHGPRANLYGYLLRCLTLGGLAPKGQAPIVWTTTLHSDPEKDFMGRGFLGICFTKLHMKVLKKMDHYFAISTAFREQLEQSGITPKRITTIYNGVDFNPIGRSFQTEFSEELTHTQHKSLTRESLGLTTEDFVMITVGRLHPVKGHEYILAAVRELRNEGLLVKWLIIGDGPLEQELKQKVKEDKLEEVVYFLGQQEPADSFYEIADLKILASLSESFPLVLLEAARAKVPIIATEVGGIKDLIDTPDKGWIIPPQNPIAIISAVKEAIGEKQNGRLKDYGHRIHEHAKQNFTVDKLAKDIEKTYHDLFQDNTA